MKRKKCSLFAISNQNILPSRMPWVILDILHSAGILCKHPLLVPFTHEYQTWMKLSLRSNLFPTLTNQEITHIIFPIQSWLTQQAKGHLGGAINELESTKNGAVFFEDGSLLRGNRLSEGSSGELHGLRFVYYKENGPGTLPAAW